MKEIREAKAAINTNNIILAGKALRYIFDKKITSTEGTPQNKAFAKYWSPIPDDKFAKVIDLVNNGGHKYQKL